MKQVAEGEDPHIETALKNMSTFAIVDGLVKEVVQKVDEEIHVKETLKKLPKYNVIYSVDLVQEVNSILIKDYDHR